MKLAKFAVCFAIVTLVISSLVFGFSLSDLFSKFKTSTGKAVSSSGLPDCPQNKVESCGDLWDIVRESHESVEDFRNALSVECSNSFEVYNGKNYPCQYMPDYIDCYGKDRSQYHLEECYDSTNPPPIVLPTCASDDGSSSSWLEVKDSKLGICSDDSGCYGSFYDEETDKYYNCVPTFDADYSINGCEETECSSTCGNGDVDGKEECDSSSEDSNCPVGECQKNCQCSRPEKCTGTYVASCSCSFWCERPPETWGSIEEYNNACSGCPGNCLSSFTNDGMFSTNFYYCHTYFDRFFVFPEEEYMNLRGCEFGSQQPCSLDCGEDKDGDGLPGSWSAEYASYPQWMKDSCPDLDCFEVALSEKIEATFDITGAAIQGDSGKKELTIQQQVYGEDVCSLVCCGDGRYAASSAECGLRGSEKVSFGKCEVTKAREYMCPSYQEISDATGNKKTELIQRKLKYAGCSSCNGENSEEVCDGIDNNCNLLVDDGVLTSNLEEIGEDESCVLYSSLVYERSSDFKEGLGSNLKGQKEDDLEIGQDLVECIFAPAGTYFHSIDNSPENSEKFTRNAECHYSRKVVSQEYFSSLNPNLEKYVTLLGWKVESCTGGMWPCKLSKILDYEDCLVPGTEGNIIDNDPTSGSLSLENFQQCQYFSKLPQNDIHKLNWEVKKVKKNKCTDGWDNDGAESLPSAIEAMFNIPNAGEIGKYSILDDKKEKVIESSLKVRLTDVDDPECHNIKCDNEENEDYCGEHCKGSSDKSKSYCYGLDIDGDGFFGCVKDTNNKNIELSDCNYDKTKNMGIQISKFFPDCDDNPFDDSFSGEDELGQYEYKYEFECCQLKRYVYCAKADAPSLGGGIQKSIMKMIVV